MKELIELAKENEFESDHFDIEKTEHTDHDLTHLSGNLVITEQNGGSANSIKIHPDLMDNFNKFLSESS